MSDTIQSFLNDGKLNTSSLTVKIVKTFGDNAYIVADKSKVAIKNNSDKEDYNLYPNNGIESRAQHFGGSRETPFSQFIPGNSQGWHPTTRFG